jgi:stage II sporulation protein Q
MIFEVEKMKHKIRKLPLEVKTGIGLTLIGSLVLGGVLLFDRNEENVTTSSYVETISSPLDNVETPDQEDVGKEIEVLIRPYLIDASISHYFYDMNDDLTFRKQAIVKIPNQDSSYMKSVGVDYYYLDKEFDVIAVCSGKVINKSNDSVYGNLICIENEVGIQTIYASLSSIDVALNDEITQGSVIGKAGTSLYTSEIGNSLHFELIKDGTYLNPEKSYSIEINSL